MYITDKDGNYIPSTTIQGEDGKEVELRVYNGYIQWKREDTLWTNLINMDVLQGKPGDKIMLRAELYIIQYKYESDSEWTNLVDLSEYFGNTAAAKAAASANEAAKKALEAAAKAESSFDNASDIIDKASIAAKETGMVQHANRHYADGEDPIDPFYIGAAYRDIIYNDIVVSASDWIDDATYVSNGYGYRADIAIDDITSSMIVHVDFNDTDRMSGKFYFRTTSFDGGVSIYASEIPENDITITEITAKHNPSVSHDGVVSSVKYRGVQEWAKEPIDIYFSTGILSSGSHICLSNGSPTVGDVLRCRFVSDTISVNDLFTVVELNGLPSISFSTNTDSVSVVWTNNQVAEVNINNAMSVEVFTDLGYHMPLVPKEYLPVEEDPTVYSWAKRNKEPYYIPLTPYLGNGSQKDIFYLVKSRLTPPTKIGNSNMPLMIQVCFHKEDDQFIAYQPLQVYSGTDGVYVKSEKYGKITWLSDEIALVYLKTGGYQIQVKNNELKDEDVTIPSYKIPLANEEHVGGVKPVAATEEMTQPVGADSEGRLFTAPSANGEANAEEWKTLLDIVTTKETMEISQTFDKVKSIKAFIITPPSGKANPTYLWVRWRVPGDVDFSQVNPFIDLPNKDYVIKAVINLDLLTSGFARFQIGYGGGGSSTDEALTTPDMFNGGAGAFTETAFEPKHMYTSSDTSEITGFDGFSFKAFNTGSPFPAGTIVRIIGR